MLNQWRCTKSNGPARRLLGPSLALAGAFLVSGTASAQARPWTLNGSDTWYDMLVMEYTTSDGVKHPGGAMGALAPETPVGQWERDNQGGVDFLDYLGGGSGTGEAALTGNTQCVAPMSRNLKCSVTSAHPQWKPTIRNVAGLDAAIFGITNSPGHIANIKLPTPPVAPGVADPNNPWRILLAGLSGKGDPAECADQSRVDAKDLIAYLQNTATGDIEHFYRRDDNSGTTDTMKERLGISAFCNGTAIGIKGNDKTNLNLNNQDLDPIRRPCVVLPGQRATSCTDSAGRPCTAGQANCTQGLLVALSIGDNDTSLRDVTTTIGSRINTSYVNGTFDVMGLAGREAARKYPRTALAVSVNGIPPTNTAVRTNKYYLSRRLYLQFAATAQGAATCSNTLAASGGAPRVNAEVDFFNWATDPDTLGRCNLDPILKANGFIPCLDDCTGDVGLEPNNLCNGPYECAP